MSLSPSPTPDRALIPFNLYRVSQPGTARVLENRRLTPDGCDDVRHIVLDLNDLDYRYLEGQSLGVLPPGTDEKGRPHKLRLYSIASSRLGDDGQGRTATLCVKRVVYNDESGQERRGVASNYLCDLEPGDEVSVTGPAGKKFLLPDDPNANLVMLATGTGIAPFRAFLRRVHHESGGRWSGQSFLFFGVRTAAECLYRDELESFHDRPGFQAAYAFSREQKTSCGSRLYVQHRLAESLDELWPLLDRQQTYLYICGLKGMENGIVSTLRDHAQAAGHDWDGWHQTFRKSGRLLVETY